MAGTLPAIHASAMMDDVLKTLQTQRNLLTPPTMSWHDPSSYPDAAKAAERIHRAIRDNEKIGIFGDYDCDGVTSVAQLARFFRRHGADPFLRLPHRMHDGYGLQEKHIAELMARNSTLLVTVDTGVAAHDAVDRANAAGIDVIILDHHHVASFPAAFCILHPARSSVPEPHPSAAGVVCTFLHALEGDDWPEREIDLALAMIGTVADLVPLTGVNRAIVRDGLAACAELPACPLRTLLERVSPTGNVTSGDIAFRVAPRINAAGRMADPQSALLALLEGGAHLDALEQLNIERQEQTTTCIAAAIAHISSLPALPPLLSCSDASFSHGIIGLVAGKLTERFGRPSMAVAIEGEICTASLRSPPCYHITEGLARGAHLLSSYGGHAQAAGCTFSLARFPAVQAHLAADIAERTADGSLVPAVSLDAELSPKAIDLSLCRALRALEPYGQGNREPVFLVRSVTLERMRRVGTDGRHLQAQVGGCKAIGFGLGEYAPEPGMAVDLACRIGIDTWNGTAVPQLFVQDIRVAEEIAKVVGGRL